MTTYEQAEDELRRALGLTAIDPPSWTRKMLTKAEQKKIRSLRYQKDLERKREAPAEKIAEAVAKKYAAIAKIEDASRTAYDATYPRHPPRWRRIVNLYMNSRTAILSRGPLSRRDALDLVQFNSRDAVRRRQKQRDQLKRVRREDRIRGNRHQRRRLTTQDGGIFDPEHAHFVTKSRKTIKSDTYR